MPLIADLLARRVRRAGSAPLVTYYDTDSGARTELSGTTFGNWVAKTSNLLTDELLVDPGTPVELRVVAEHVGHWMGLVWAAACWQTGTVVTLGHPDGARLVVCGPAYREVERGDADLVACSLHPFGLGLAPPVPSDVVDYAVEVRGQPDVWAGVPVAPQAPAWRDADRRLTQTELLDAPPVGPRRVLVRPADPWATVRDALVGPLRDGGSAVVLSGTADEQRIAQVAAAERVDTVLRA